mmetsp:Transcript_69451/g.166493  ORF Transcript_69451/g.166493 Transcript_69451/m.166493 type:complete len:346 (+) Transcript_69451:99-1136(+)
MHARPLDRELLKELEFVSAHDAELSDTWYIIDAGWLKRWKNYVSKGGPHPGPITNCQLLCPESRFKEAKSGLRVRQHYRGVCPVTWDFFLHRYGGGPVIVNTKCLDLCSATIHEAEVQHSHMHSHVRKPIPGSPDAPSWQSGSTSRTTSAGDVSYESHRSSYRSMDSSTGSRSSWRHRSSAGRRSSAGGGQPERISEFERSPSASGVPNAATDGKRSGGIVSTMMKAFGLLRPSASRGRSKNPANTTDNKGAGKKRAAKSSCVEAPESVKSSTTPVHSEGDKTPEIISPSVTTSVLWPDLDQLSCHIQHVSKSEYAARIEYAKQNTVDQEADEIADKALRKLARV